LATALGVLGLLRVNLVTEFALAIVRSLFQLTVLVVGLAVAMEFPGWGTLIFAPLLLIIATQFTLSRCTFPLDRYALTGLLALAASFPTFYTVLLVLRPAPLYAPQVWIPLLSLSFSSASAIVLQVGNGAWQLWQRQQVNPDPPDTAPQDSPDLLKIWHTVLQQVLKLRVQQIASLGLVSLPLILAAQILVNIDPLLALGYEVLLMLVGLNSSFVAVLCLQKIFARLATVNTMRRDIPRV
jgi:ABC-type iron transport system FetAB permease component